MVDRRTVSVSLYGMAWSLLVAGGVAIGSVYATAPLSMPVGRLADRLVLGGLAGLLLGRVVAIRSGQAALNDPLGGVGGDVEFWSLVGVLGIFVASAQRPVRWRKGSERLSEVAPCVLLAFGAFQSLCWLRSYCSPSGAPRFGLELILGLALMGLALSLQFRWALSPSARIVLVVGVVSGDRLVLAAGPSWLADAWISAILVSIALTYSGIHWGTSRWRRRTQRRLLRGWSDGNDSL